MIPKHVLYVVINTNILVVSRAQSSINSNIISHFCLHRQARLAGVPVFRILVSWFAGVVMKETIPLRSFQKRILADFSELNCCLVLNNALKCVNFAH